MMMMAESSLGTYPGYKSTSLEQAEDLSQKSTPKTDNILTTTTTQSAVSPVSAGSDSNTVDSNKRALPTPAATDDDSASSASSKVSPPPKKKSKGSKLLSLVNAMRVKAEVGDR